MSMFGRGIGSGLLGEERKRAAWSRCRALTVWEKIPLGYGDFRVDDYGNIIRWEDYGNTNSEYGWEIDHIHPSALGGSDRYANLRALHFRTNRSLGGQLNALLGR